MACTAGYNPPLPQPIKGNETDLHSANSDRKSTGQKLLTLIRGIENGPENAQQNVEDAVQLMNSLIDLFSRRGLLQGDVEKAERILAFRNATPQNVAKSSNTNNESSKIKLSKMHVDMQANEINVPESNAGQPENLIFTALLRIFGSQKLPPGEDTFLLVALAAEICVAVATHTLQTDPSSANSCSLAEYELLLPIGKPILTALVTRMQSIKAHIQSSTKSTGKELFPRNMWNKCITLALLDDDVHILPVTSCLKAASLLVTLFGTKLSRSTTLLSALFSTAWTWISAPNTAVQEGAARLLASLPLAGGTDRRSPSDMWNVALVDSTAILFALLNTVAPVGKSQQQSQQSSISDASNVVLQNWLSFMREDISDHRQRVQSLHVFLKGISLCIRRLLQQGGLGLPPSNSWQLSDVTIQLDSILEIVEVFLSYPLSAETLFFRTKKRLRDESVDGGLISPRIIATQLANEVKGLGHVILASLLSGVGGPQLLPFARRIIRMSYASLLTSCSHSVRRALDPTSPVQFGGTKRRWLHLSIPLRTVAIRAVRDNLVVFGTDRASKSETFRSQTNDRNDGETAIALVVGCLIEQVGSNINENVIDECWGTFEDRAILITTCLDCLRGALVGIGGFMSLPTRSMIDSVVLTCLTKQTSSPTVDPLASWEARVKVFQLAATCVTTPWNDGAATSIVDNLRHTALISITDMNKNVASAAKDALLVCDQSGVTRAPALVNVVRHTQDKSDSTSMPMETTSTQSIMKNIEMARQETSNTRKAYEDEERIRAQEKRKRKETEEEAAKKSKKEEESSKKLENTTKISNSQDDTPGYRLDEKATSSEQSRQELTYLAVHNLRDEPGVGSNSQDLGKASTGTMLYEVSEKGISAIDKKDDDAMSKDDANDDFPDIVADGPDSDDE